MSIKELIEHLQQFPQDATAVCVYMMCSDWHILEADQIKFYPVSSGKDKNEAKIRYPQWPNHGIQRKAMGLSGKTCVFADSYVSRKLM
jgi:hypothetical protein